MTKQAHIQGVIDARVDHLNDFRRVMMDKLLDHHLISQDAVIMLLNRSFDMYEDISSISTYYYYKDPTKATVYDPVLGEMFLADSNGNYIYNDAEKVVVEPYIKKVLLDKSPDMKYVQQVFSGILAEKTKDFPYLVQLSTTDMPRLLNLGDRMKLGDKLYEVRLVSPINRLNDSVQKVMVCPVLYSDVPMKEEVDAPFVPVELGNYKKSNII